MITVSRARRTAAARATLANSQCRAHAVRTSVERCRTWRVASRQVPFRCEWTSALGTASKSAPTSYEMLELEAHSVASPQPLRYAQRLLLLALEQRGKWRRAKDRAARRAKHGERSLLTGPTGRQREAGQSSAKSEHARVVGKAGLAPAKQAHIRVASFSACSGSGSTCRSTLEPSCVITELPAHAGKAGSEDRRKMCPHAQVTVVCGTGGVPAAAASAPKAKKTCPSAHTALVSLIPT